MGMLGITRKDFINYSVMPGIGPRLREMFGTGFKYIPFFIALVYQAVRLLPQGHPYANIANLGRFGIRHVVAEAANNLVFSWKNADQIILFVTLLVGVVLFFVQIILVGLWFVVGPAMAVGIPVNFTGFFITPVANAPQDLAYMMFDLIFGIDNLFQSCVDQTPLVACLDADGNPIVDPANNWVLQGLGWPFPIHEGLHSMFFMYNTGLLVVATMITIYFIIVIFMETAQSGTAFGKRFNKVWAPVRLVMAFGLLIPYGVGPTTGGLNSSQFIVLYAAKYGSGFATNGWNLFNNVLVGAYTGALNNLISEPQRPEMNGLLQFVYTAGVCYEMELMKNATMVWPYAVKDNRSNPNAGVIYYPGIVGAPPTPATTMQIGDYQDLINFAAGDRQVVINFGYQDPVRFKEEKGHVKPVCGQIIFPLMDSRDPAALLPQNRPERSALFMQVYYFSIIKELWFLTFDGYVNCILCAPPEMTAPINFTGPPAQFAIYTMQKWTQWNHNPNAPEPPPEYRSTIQDFYQKDIYAALTNPGPRGINTLDPLLLASPGAIQEGIASGRWAVTAPMRQKGWAAAGIWYNKIAEMNGVLSAAVLNIPIPSLYPMVMEDVKQAKKQQNQDTSTAERFKPELANGDDVPCSRPEDCQMRTALWEAFKYWQFGGFATTTHTISTGNPVIDFVNQIFGTSGLYSIRRNQGIHPLAQLVGVGRSLIESATRNLGAASLASIVGSGLEEFGAAGATAAVSLLMMMVTIALTAGFILYYVVPFMPFIYFFFAVGGWFKAIFEAMVGAPLWALAHIRIDGHGLPGQAATQGYFLILEIFLRPILIIFGFLGSISIFAAMVSVLNQTWDLVVANLSGFDVETELCLGGGPGCIPVTPGTPSMMDFFRGPIDEFFFTVIYTIVVYLMAMSSFKLVDVIPANILRWMGQSVMTFNDAKEDAGESLVGTATIGVQQSVQNLGGGAQKAMEGLINRPR